MSTPDNRIRRPKAEASATGWLGLFFGSDEQNDRRLTLAFACALALNAILIGLFIGLSHRPGPVQREVVSHVAVVAIAHATPTPKPKPTPKPTPHPAVIARVVDPGRSAHVEVIKRVAASRPKTVTIHHSKPVSEVPVGGQGAGEGRKGTTGSLGTGGTGTGAGGEGNGSGGICGSVDFADSQEASYDASTGTYIYDGVQMIVHYSDGTAKTITLDYPWHYRDESMDPFKHADAPMWFQFPPKSMRASEPPEVQYVMQHSSPEGSTDLNLCPGQS